MTAIISAVGLAGCNDELDRKTTLTFVGDSLIARWDLQASFSSLATTNRGISGSGIAYIERIAGEMRGKNIVVLIGTNDSYMMIPSAREAYADRYLAAIDALGADRVYLYEVLPRDFYFDTQETNRDIAAFNSLVRSKLENYPRITYVPVYDLFLADDGNVNVEYYTDMLHLSPQGYQILSARLFESL